MSIPLWSAALALITIVLILGLTVIFGRNEKEIVQRVRHLYRGSTNFDNRSFKLNDEASLNVYNGQFAKRQVADFKADLTRSKRITLQEWKKRPWTEKAWECGLKIIRPELQYCLPQL